MIRDIVHDPIFLSQKSQPAGKADKSVGQDMKDTLKAHKNECVGMAANMIGQLKRIIVFQGEQGIQLMYNPEIIKKMGPYEAEEGCLSLSGTRKTRRFRMISVKYQDESFLWKEAGFAGFTAQIIQHECDHLDGTLI